MAENVLATEVEGHLTDLATIAAAVTDASTSAYAALDSGNLAEVQNQIAAVDSLLNTEGVNAGDDCANAILANINGTQYDDLPETFITDARDEAQITVDTMKDALIQLQNDYDQALIAQILLKDGTTIPFAGNGALYTLEYFEMCRRRLRPGGVVSMWLPVYSLDTESYLRILSAFHMIFPRTVVWYDHTTPNEFTVVTGKVEPGPVTIDWRRLTDPALAGSLEIGGISSALDLEADLLLGPSEVAALVADVPPHIDDLPFVEYTAGRTLDRLATWYANLLTLAAARTLTDPFEAAPVPFDEAVEIRDRDLARTLRKVQTRSIPGM